MRTLNHFVLLCVITILLVITVENILAENNINTKIDSNGKARLTVEQYTGFGKIPNITSENQFNIDTITMKNDKTPFINNMINNRKLHRVVIEDIPVNTFRNINYDRPPVNFEILLDSETGKLLKIATKLKDTSIVKIREDLTKTNRGFSGLPDAKPYPFLEILKKCPHSLSKAVEIEAVYILRQSKIDGPGIPTWIVSLYAVPTIVSSPARGSNSGFVEPRARTIMMNYDIIFDGITGKLLTSGGKERK